MDNFFNQENPVIQIIDLYKKYKEGKGFSIKGINFKLPKGSSLGLMGSSGSGKSTLLKCIARMTQFDSGEILYSGKDIEYGQAGLLRGHDSIRLVHQDFDLNEQVSVRENLSELMLSYEQTFIDNRIDTLLELSYLKDYAGNRPRELSGGQRQRLGIIKKMVDIPEVLLLDEPFSQLDPPLQRRFMEFIHNERLVNEQSQIIVSHHSSDLLAYCDPIIVLKNGEIVGIQKPLELYFRPQSAYTASLCGPCNWVPKKIIEHFNIKIPISRSDYTDMPVRPTEFILNEKGALKGKILKLDFMGDYYRIKVMIPKMNDPIIVFSTHSPSEEEVTLDIQWRY